MLTFQDLTHKSAAVFLGVLRDSENRSETDARTRWFGNGAKNLGLEGKVTVEGLSALMQARSPKDGSLLLETELSKAAEGSILTFSAPPNVSSLWAACSSETRKSIESAHEAAVNAALSFFRSEWSITSKQQGQLGGGLAAAIFEYSDRRPLSELQSHAVLVHMELIPGGSWGLMSKSAIRDDRRVAETLYEAELSMQLDQKLGIIMRGSLEFEGLPGIEELPGNVAEDIGARHQKGLYDLTEKIGLQERDEAVGDRDRNRTAIASPWTSEAANVLGHRKPHGLVHVDDSHHAIPTEHEIARECILTAFKTISREGRQRSYSEIIKEAGQNAIGMGAGGFAVLQEFREAIGSGRLIRKEPDKYVTQEELSRSLDLTSLAKEGRVELAVEEIDAIRSIAEHWVAHERAKDPRPLIVTFEEKDVHTLNLACQLERIKAGLLNPSDGVNANFLDPKTREASQVQLYPGDRVEMHKFNDALSLQAGETGTISKITKANGTPILWVEMDRRETVLIPLRDYPHVSSGYATTRQQANNAEYQRAYIFLSEAPQDLLIDHPFEGNSGELRVFVSRKAAGEKLAYQVDHNKSQFPLEASHNTVPQQEIDSHVPTLRR